MIFTDRTITVRKGESRIDEPIVVYRGDYELEVRFTILNSRFKFMSGTNMIESEKASYGQLAILTPYGGNIFSDVVRCNDGSVTFVLTAEMLNQIEEVGLYSFQIRLMDYNKESRVSIPPIEFGIEVREPIASEDHDNSVNNAIVGYSIAKVVDPKEENVGDTFDVDGDYNKTKWETGDRISEGKLNKIEDAINRINQNEKNNTASLSKRIDNNYNVMDSIKADKNEIFTMANMGQDIREAMTGGSVAVVGENSISSSNIIDGSIKARDIEGQILPSFIFSENGYIDYTFDDANKSLVISLPKTAYLIVGSSYYLIGENNASHVIRVAYPEAQTAGINTLWWSRELSEFQLLSYVEYNTYGMQTNSEKILVATVGFTDGKGKTVHANGIYTVNGALPCNSLRDNSITSRHIASRSIEQSDINNQIKPLRICADSRLKYRVSESELIIKVPKYCYLTIGTDLAQITSGSPKEYYISYSTVDNAGINFVIFDSTNKNFELINHLSFETIKSKNDKFIVGTFSPGSVSGNGYYLYLEADYMLEGDPVENKRLVTFCDSIIVDMLNRKIKFPRFLVTGGEYFLKDVSPERVNGNVSSYITFDIPKPSEYIIYTYYLDNNALKSWSNSADNNECPIKMISGANTPTDYTSREGVIVLATSMYNTVTSNYPIKFINDSSKITWGTYNARHGCMDFRWSEYAIVFPSDLSFIQTATAYYSIDKTNLINGVKLEIENTTDGLQWLLFDINKKQFTTRHYSKTLTNDSEYILIATFWIGSDYVETMSPYSIHGKYLNLKIPEIPEIPESVDDGFELNNTRLILPNTIFLVNNETLPVYLSSAIPDPLNMKHIKGFALYSPDDKTSEIEKFTDRFVIATDTIGDNMMMGYTIHDDYKQYYKNINIKRCDTSNISNRQPKILHIGDSITNRNVANRSETFLKTWGVAPTYVGTMNNSGKRGEGREGWEYVNFVGISNIWGNNGSVIEPDTSSQTTNLNLNPFLKIASSSDISNHPDWCFTYTRSRRETSYTNSVNKNQTFFIFDFANYLDAHNVDTPDIVTIALSTNDICRNSDFMETSLLSMDIMISVIREQFPNIKIGIVPSPAWGYSDVRFKDKVSYWIEECIKAINSRNDDKIFIIPIWCHMNREWGFNLDADELSETNDSMVGTISDVLHPNIHGQREYGKAMAMFIANTCL